MKRATLILATLAFVFGGTRQAKADLAVDFPGAPNHTYPGASLSLGFEFQANSNVLVTGLANIDLGVTYPQAQQVGLWTVGGTLLASAYVTQSDPLAGSGYWRVASITPVALTAGQDYIVGSQGNAAYAGLTPITVNPNITFIQDLYGVTNGANNPLVLPTLSEGYTSPSYAAWFGGNVELSTVPEPSGLAQFGMGILCLAVVGYTVRRRKLALTAA